MDEQGIKELLMLILRCGLVSGAVITWLSFIGGRSIEAIAAAIIRKRANRPDRSKEKLQQKTDDFFHLYYGGAIENISHGNHLNPSNIAFIIEAEDSIKYCYLNGPIVIEKLK